MHHGCVVAHTLVKRKSLGGECLPLAATAWAATPSSGEVSPQRPSWLRASACARAVLLLRCAAHPKPLQRCAPLNGSLEKPGLRIVTATFPLTAALPGLFQFAEVRGSCAEPLVCSAPPSRPSAPERLAGGAALPPETFHRFAPLMSHASSYRRFVPRRTALAQPLRW